MHRNDKPRSYFYINLIEDHEAVNYTLLIHNQPCIFVNIPRDTNLRKFNDAQFKLINNAEKIYFAAHGSSQVDNAVTSSLRMDSTIYYINDIVDFFSRILHDEKYKNPELTPRLKIVMSVCEGVNFAKNFQKKLCQEQGIYVDVVANRHLVSERFEKLPENKLNMFERAISVNPSSEKVHQLPHSKVLLIIDKDGKQKAIDAYELKWIETVLHTIVNKYQGFLRWADFSKHENYVLKYQFEKFLNKILQIVKNYLLTNANKTANLLLCYLMNTFNQNNSKLKALIKSDYIRHDINDLIKQGQNRVQLDEHLSTQFLAQKLISNKQDLHSDIESARACVRAAKLIYSSLLKEYDDNLSGIKKENEEDRKVVTKDDIDEAKKLF